MEVKVFMGLGILLFNIGCTYRGSYVISSQSLSETYEEPLAVVEGNSSSFYFLFLGPFGDDSLLSAVRKSLDADLGDALVNVFAERQVTFFPFTILPLVTVIETRVMGTAVQYKYGSDIERPRINEEEKDTPNTNSLRKIP